MNELCFDLEVQQGKNIANASTKTKTLDRYIWSSLSDIKKWSKGKYTWVYCFDGKAKVAEYIKEELPELGGGKDVGAADWVVCHASAECPFPSATKGLIILSGQCPGSNMAERQHSNRTEHLSSL